MDKLRVDSGIKKIEVNDTGECIQFSVTDSRFFESFFDLINWFEGDDLKKSIDDVESQKDDIDNTDDMTAIKKIVDLQKNIITQAMEKIDGIFGEDASRKIFCDTIPDIYAIADFFEKITPFVEKYAKERNRNISKKYSTKRRGAKS